MALIAAEIKKVREVLTLKLDSTVVEQQKLCTASSDSTRGHIVKEAGKTNGTRV